MTMNLNGVRRISLRECLITPDTAADFMNDMTRFVSTNPEQAAQLEATSRLQLETAYGYDEDMPDAERKPFVFKDGIAVIPVHGTLVNRFNASWGFVTGYNYIRRMMNAAMADDDVDAIVLDIDSPGGEAAGNFELAEEIREARETKPILAMVDSLSASGGYAISSGATRIWCIPSGRIGSIGVYRMHIDVSKAMEQQGLKMTFAVAGDNKIDGNPYEPISEEVLDDWRESAGKTWDQFIALVASGRNIPEAQVRETQARIYRAEEALDLGLIDAVRTTTEAVAAFVAELAGSEPNNSEDEEMNQPKTTEVSSAPAAPAAGLSISDVNAAVAAALAADRERSATIRNCDEATGKPKLAAELAASDISVEQAKSFLKAAAVETPAAAETPSGDDGDEEEEEEEGDEESARSSRKNGDNVNHLENAMKTTSQPNAGAGKESKSNDGEVSETDLTNQILADAAAVTGFDYQPKKDKAA